mgnify:CR=1 FL=1
MRQWLIDARKSCGLTQKQIGERIGVRAPTFWAYEHEKITPTVATAKKIASVLDIDWMRFYDESQSA